MNNGNKYIFGKRLDKIYIKLKLHGKLPPYFCNLQLENSNLKSFYNNIKCISNRKNNNLTLLSYDSKIKQLTNEKSEIIQKKKIDNSNIFINFNKNKFVENLNNTGKDYLIFKIKLRKNNPYKSKYNEINSSLSSDYLTLNKNKGKNKNIFNKTTSNEKKLFFKNSTNKVLPEKDSLFINTLYSNNYPFRKKTKVFKEKQYRKKWDLPKALSFDKLSGREEIKIKRKFTNIQGKKNYTPNYNSIFMDTSKTFVHYGKNIKTDFQNKKSDVTRKTICNYKKLIESFGSNYSVINLIKEERRKKKEKRIKKMKELFGQFYEFIDNDKKINKLKLQMFE